MLASAIGAGAGVPAAFERRRINGNIEPPRATEKVSIVRDPVRRKDKGTGAKEIHSVLASPGAVAAYVKMGQFLGGTIIVKEVYGTPTDKPAKTTSTAHTEDCRPCHVPTKDTDRILIQVYAALKQ